MLCKVHTSTLALLKRKASGKCLEVFEIADVAKIVGVPISRIKNWTIGRPFRVRPTVRAARGKGTRNLYSTQDVYILGLINQMTVDGIAPSTIQQFLWTLQRSLELKQALLLKPWLVLRVYGSRVQIDLVNDEIASQTFSTRTDESFGRYILDLGRLLDQIRLRIVHVLVDPRKEKGA